MGISKRLRFEVFKRDSFTCQYCGRKAPDVVLHIDHIIPKAEGGDDDLLNLITSCAECNLGKGPRELRDDTVIRKQRAQLELLQERHEQMEMMVQWQRSLLDSKTRLADELSEMWDELVPGYQLSENGYRDVSKWLERYGFDEIATSMRICTDQYLGTVVTQESAEKAFSYIPRICVSRARMEEKPYLRDLYYIRGILRNRLNYVREWEALALMERAVIAGIPIDEIKALALRSSSWRCWDEDMEAFIAKTQMD